MVLRSQSKLDVMNRIEQKLDAINETLKQQKNT